MFFAQGKREIFIEREYIHIDIKRERQLMKKKSGLFGLTYADILSDFPRQSRIWKKEGEIIVTTQGGQCP